MAGLLTCSSYRLPSRLFSISGFKQCFVYNLVWNLQQRDCSGFSPDSLLIAYSEIEYKQTNTPQRYEYSFLITAFDNRKMLHYRIFKFHNTTFAID